LIYMIFQFRQSRSQLFLKSLESFGLSLIFHNVRRFLARTSAVNLWALYAWYRT
jgi:hypothetical protein